jgi:hypothetical protein
MFGAASSRVAAMAGLVGLMRARMARHVSTRSLLGALPVGAVAAVEVAVAVEVEVEVTALAGSGVGSGTASGSSSGSRSSARASAPLVVGCVTSRAADAGGGGTTRAVTFDPEGAANVAWLAWLA